LEKPITAATTVDFFFTAFVRGVIKAKRSLGRKGEGGKYVIKKKGDGGT
jgi:hypothetical protein